VNSMLAQINARIGRRGIAAAILTLLALLVAVATPQILGTRVADSFSALRSAEPIWLWLAGTGFAISVLAAAGSWRCAIGPLRRPPLGHRRLRALRHRLARQHARALPRRRRRPDRPLQPRASEREAPLTTGGAFAALGAARAVVLGALVVAGYLAGAVPLWPLLIAAALVAAAVGVAIASGRAAPTYSTPSARSHESRGAPPASSPGSRSRPAAGSSPRPRSAPRSTSPTRSPPRS